MFLLQASVEFNQGDNSLGSKSDSCSVLALILAAAATTFQVKLLQ